MDASFWQQRWATNQIGFHEAEVHPMLRAHGERLGAAGRVFVPLCGKSNDMVWLHGLGHQMVGIELADIALRAFFAEHGMTPAHSHDADFAVFDAEAYHLLCGDYFALTPATLGAVTAIYDRAALIALPPDMRRDYAAKMTALVAPDTRMLLVTVDYDASAIMPPPFAVTAEEVASLYGASWSIENLGQRQADVKGQPGVEQAFLLSRR
jgi:thiopurine S-methyltransferase